MRLYNTLSRKVETLPHDQKKRVNLFVCGPTVYGYAHIGNARTYLVYDALVKFMRRRLRWDVLYLQNITDIDDKIIARARQSQKGPLELASEMEKAYLEDTEALGIDSVDEYAPATRYIPEIISQVERLLKKKNAYVIEEDGVYFDVATFKGYGRLSGRTAEQAEDAVTRIDESVNKRNKADFALWKLSKPMEPSWDSPFGAGRPGWHIEDTAIAEKHFGFTYDMHGGAVDLVFPHHEAEIAQMESLSGVSPMVRVWVHAGILSVDSKKMSKSEGNVVTIREFLKEHSAEAFRMFAFSSHWRSPVDYTEKAIQEARGKVERLKELRSRLGGVEDTQVSPFPYQPFVNAFWEALTDDFNTPKALAELFQLATETHKLLDSHTLSKKDAQSLLAFMGEVNAIFKLLPPEEGAGEVPADVASLTSRREEARAKGQYKEADKLREEIRKRGFEVGDTDGGPRIRKAATHDS